MLLKGKKILITGVANDWSMAWAIAKRAHDEGAEIAMPYAMPTDDKSDGLPKNESTSASPCGA